MIADRFAVPSHHNSSSGLPAYAQLPYSHTQGDLQYSNYSYTSHSHAFENERRYMMRESDSMMQPSPVYSSPSGRHPSSKAGVEMPRPLAIPSLLPSNAPPTSNRVLGRIGTDSIHGAEFHTGMQQQEITSPLSAVDPQTSARSSADEPTGSTITHPPRREPSLVVIACRQW